MRRTTIELFHDEYENVERMTINGNDVPVDMDYIRSMVDDGTVSDLDITNYYI